MLQNKDINFSICYLLKENLDLIVGLPKATPNQKPFSLYPWTDPDTGKKC